MTSYDPAAGLTIGAVSARTGVSVPVLRAWEQRHAFPRPARLDGGHRRYDERVVAQIQRVVAEREAGRTLAVAIELARQAPSAAEESGASTRDVTDDATVFAGLRRHRPDLEAHVVSRRTMLALSHAIEDECLAAADRPTLTAAFQTVSAFRLAQPRWRELARVAASTLVFADFDRSRTRRNVHEVSLPAEAALHREWSVVCDAPRAGAVLAGWERADGRFEALWSVEPDVIRLATRIGRSLAEQFAPRVRLAPVPDAPVEASEVDPSLHLSLHLRRATALTNRVVANLDRVPV